MLPRQWEDFRNQFDENDERSKKSFNDLLSMLQRESFYRDTLAEALIFKQSCVRLSFKQDVQFTNSAQEKNIQNSFNADNNQDQNVQPSFSYLIVELRMFHFMNTMMLLMTNDQGTCQLYDCDSGVLQHSFEFDQSFTAKDMDKQQKRPGKVTKGPDHESDPANDQDAQDEDGADGADALSKTMNFKTQLSKILKEPAEDDKRGRSKTITDPKALQATVDQVNASKIEVIVEADGEDKIDDKESKKGKKARDSQMLNHDAPSSSFAESITLGGRMTRGNDSTEPKQARNNSQQLSKFKTQIGNEKEKPRQSKLMPLNRPRTLAGRAGK